MDFVSPNGKPISQSLFTPRDAVKASIRPIFAKLEQGATVAVLFFPRRWAHLLLFSCVRVCHVVICLFVYCISVCVFSVVCSSERGALTPAQRETVVEKATALFEAV